MNTPGIPRVCIYIGVSLPLDIRVLYLRQAIKRYSDIWRNLAVDGDSHLIGKLLQYRTRASLSPRAVNTKYR